VRLSTIRRFANPRHVWRGRGGFCPVCAGWTWFLITCEPAGLRNDAFCARCGSLSRTRHLVLAILDAFRDRGVRSLVDLARRPNVAVWHTSARGPIARRLTDAAPQHLVLSEFFDDVPPGQRRDGILCQDLQALTFDDESFDLVISEDVFEHIPDCRTAFAEVHRVLKPGGCHAFTVPYYPAELTASLFEATEHGWTPKGPVEYHDDPIRGRIATYTRFGRDFAGWLEGLGCGVTVHTAGDAEIRRHATFDCTSFVTRKGVA
jgi:SAM-dependent methyltransferase